MRASFNVAEQAKEIGVFGKAQRSFPIIIVMVHGQSFYFSTVKLPTCRYHLKIEPGMVEHVCNPSSWEAEAGGSQVQGQLWAI
jgi:hypothetical protein